MAPLHAQTLLALGQARLLLPAPHTDVTLALATAQSGYGALSALLSNPVRLPPPAHAGARTVPPGFSTMHD